VEKPLAMNAVEGQKMLDAARKNKKHLVIGFQHRFEGRTKIIRRAFDEGLFGKVLFVRVQALRRRGIPNWGVFGRKDLLEKLKPYKVEPAPNDPPEKWEMGTRDQSLFASITDVMDYLNWLGSKTEHEVKDKITAYSDKQRLLKAALYWIEEYEKVLSGTMLDGTETVAGMNSMKGLEVYGMRDSARLNLRAPTFSFNIIGADPHEVAEYMWKKHSVALLAENNGGFYSRALRTYGRSVAVRASPVHFNSTREVEHFLSGLSDALKHFNAS
jgi:selenocysteine lyase/cysteine desulfurase